MKKILILTTFLCFFLLQSYCNINKAHFKWNRVSTYTNRISVYKRTLRYHKLWLTKILDMEDSRLNQNTLELNSAEIKQMTKELLKIL